MRKFLIASITLLSGLAIGGGALASAAEAQDNRRGYGVSRGEAISIARGYGIWRVSEIERDDGGWEIEGRDRAGREIEIEINSRGQVTDVDRDYGRDDDDRDDDYDDDDDD